MVVFPGRGRGIEMQGCEMEVEVRERSAQGKMGGTGTLGLGSSRAVESTARKAGRDYPFSAPLEGGYATT